MRYQRTTNKSLREVLCLELQAHEVEALITKAEKYFTPNPEVRENLLKSWENLKS